VNLDLVLSWFSAASLVERPVYKVISGIIQNKMSLEKAHRLSHDRLFSTGQKLFFSILQKLCFERT